MSARALTLVSDMIRHRQEASMRFEREVSAIRDGINATDSLPYSIEDLHLIAMMLTAAINRHQEAYR